MTRPPDPLTLRLFVAVCEEGSIARAAAREAMVPSAVSKRLSALTGRLGTGLFARGRRGLEPTAAGQALLRQAREVLGALERLQAELGGFAAGVQGSLRVAASVSALAEDLPDDVAAFVDRHPGVRVSLDERNGEAAVRDVLSGSAELGVAWDAVDARGLRTVPYRGDRLCVVVARSHPLARRAAVRFADTLDHESVGVAPGGLVDRMTRRQAALVGRTPNHRMQVSSLDAALRIVAAGLGLAIVPREAAMLRDTASRTVLLLLDEAWAARRFVVITRADAALPGPARLLVDHLATRAGADPAATPQHDASPD